MSAVSIIEKFGGVRALAEKMTAHLGKPVPVTTVQYWKDIDRIPAGRQDDILSCGKQFEVNVSPADFFSQSDKPNGGPLQEAG